MSILFKESKKGCRDCYHAYLVKTAIYAGDDEMPCIKTCESLPEKIIAFSKAIQSQDNDQWIHFYEHDSKIESIWNNPKRYLPMLKRHAGVISPDFSVYCDMPLVQQKWNIYRGRAIANWMVQNGIDVIPNIRWGDERTYESCCEGIEKSKTIAVGTHGCIKTIEEKKLFIRGFDYVINKLEPKNIVVYGRMPDKIFCLAKMHNIDLLHFDSEFALSHKKVVM